MEGRKTVTFGEVEEAGDVVGKFIQQAVTSGVYEQLLRDIGVSKYKFVESLTILRYINEDIVKIVEG